MTFRLTEIHAGYDAAIGRIIRTVGAEFGAIGEGFGPSDKEVTAMSHHYDPAAGSVYYVALQGGQVVGGCGLAPFAGSSEICELRKLFLLPQNRGQGIGYQLTTRCLEFARSSGYKQCYLDTLSTMQAAIALYSKLGFTRLAKPLPNAVHSGCNVWMLKSLQ